MKILKVIISCFLSILLSCLLIALSVISIAQGTLNIKAQVSNILIKNVYAEKELTSADLLNIQNLTPSEIHGYLDNYLIENDIPTEALDYVLSSGDYKSIINNYINDYQNYLAGIGEKPVIPTESINTLINDGLTKYNEETGSNIDIENITTTVTENISKVEEQINKVSENSYVKTGFKILYNPLLQTYLIIGIVVLIGLLILINWSFVKSLPYLITASTFSGIFLTVAKVAIEKINIIGELNIINGILNKVSDKIITFGIVYLVLSVILIIIYFILKKTDEPKEISKTK